MKSFVTPGRGGLPHIAVANDACRAEVSLHGAHVTRWQPGDAGEVLWLSERAVFAPDAPIRGGVPICWPWFGPHPSDPQARAHGFARTRLWTLNHIEAGDAETRVRLSLHSDDSTRALWPHEFELTLDAVFGTALELRLTTRNTGPAPFTITEALHTYLAVHDVRTVQVAGLSGAAYADKVQGGSHIQTDRVLSIVGETDRVYTSENECLVIDGARRVLVEKTGSRSTVVWNPWREKAARLADFGDDEWPGMLCIEAANALDAAVAIAPGASHTIAARIRVA